ncbi:MAG: exodeoxyribonuclease VII small subunit [Bacilli bacterium]|nr:exodeoxyribonuclease VII small subunit [Bacilli bacterium]
MEKKELSFEENIKKLESIVKELESGEVPLDDAINKFNEASKIASLCDEKLKNATDSINKIMNDDGSLKEFKVEE